MWLNPLFISSVLFGTTSLSLAIVVPFFGKKDIHKIWSFFNFLVAWWGFSLALICLAGPDKEKAKYLWVVANSGGLFIAVFFYHFVALFCEYKKKPFLIFTYLQGCLFLLLTIFGKLNFSLTYVYGSFYYARVKSPLYLLETMCWLLTVLYGHIILYKTLRRSSGDKSIEIKYLFVAIFIGFFSGGASHWLQAFGYPVHPAWNVFITLYTLLVTYAIFRHKLLNIDIIIRRGFVYSLLIFSLTFIYLSIILISEYIFRSYFGYRSVFIAIFASFIVAIIFNPLQSRIQKFLDKYFFKIDTEKIIEENVRLKNAVQKQDHMKAVATLAAGMAHEIKNPLTSIKTFAEYLPQRYDDPEFREKFQRIVVDEVDRVNNIVKQLLEFSKPRELELKATPIVSIVDDTLSLLNSNLLKNKIEVIKDYKANPSPLVDKNQLRQAFLNIFLNSIHAMPNGGTLKVVIQIASPKPSATLAMTKIVISDTGCGIPKEHLPHVFDPFYSTKEEGTGLGLSIVHGIITKHGGKIKVESEEKQGTTISVIL